MEQRRRIRCVFEALAVAGLAIVVGSLAPGAAGMERLQRRYDLERGLPYSEITSLGQDSLGFIWIGTTGGLFRYDGVELRPWPRETSLDFVRSLTTGPAGAVMILGYGGSVQEVSGDGVRPVKGPSGQPLVATAPPIWDRDGTLWIATADRLWLRSTGGSWRELPLAPFGPVRSYSLKEAEDGSIIAVTDNAVWRADPTQRFTRLVSMEGIQTALVAANGTIDLLLRGSVVEVRNGTKRELFRSVARPIDMVRRGETLWVGYDSCLVTLAPGRPPEILGPGENVASGAALLVDRERSLWVGTYRGLLQFPEPDTVALGSAEGMAGDAVRRLSSTPEGIWADSWSGLTLLRRRAGAWKPESIPGTSTNAVCTGTDGRLWTGAPDRILERTDRRFIDHPFPGQAGVRGCAAGHDGRVWLAGDRGLAVADGTLGSSPRLVPGPPGLQAERGDVSLLEDSSTRIWFAHGEQICRAAAGDVAAGRGASWTCARIPGAETITSLAELSSGSLWASTLRAGVCRLGADDRWEPIAGPPSHSTRLVRKLRASPSGGAWIVSYGTVLRAVEPAGAGRAWEVAERIVPWDGLMISDAEDVLEEPSGDLWITTLIGLVHVPANVRRASRPVPDVALVDVLVDGQPLAWQNGVSLPHRRNRIELRFAGLSYRDPGLLRYQVRLRADAPWQDASAQPRFQFVDLPPGRYRAEVRASLDGVRWSPTTAQLSLEVLPPYWRTGWFTTLVALAAASLAYGVHRFRLTQLLRVERVRTRIAADLHDDIGASLSLIALQSELIRRPADPGSPDAQRLLGGIADSARGLVDSMSDIVWSIDPRHDDLASVIARLRELALGLMEPRGIALAFRTPPGAEKVRLTPERRRHLYLILKEAIHNVVRHAGCRNVSITLTADGNGLHAEVADDGRGFAFPEAGSVAPRGRVGHGLQNMRSRAEQIGGTLSVRSAAGEGTMLSLSLPVHRGA